MPQTILARLVFFSGCIVGLALLIGGLAHLLARDLAADSDSSINAIIAEFWCPDVIKGPQSAKLIDILLATERPGQPTNLMRAANRIPVLQTKSVAEGRERFCARAWRDYGPQGLIYPDLIAK